MEGHLNYNDSPVCIFINSAENTKYKANTSNFLNLKLLKIVVIVVSRQGWP